MIQIPMSCLKMVSEYYKEQPMPGLRVYQEDECKCLGELSDGEDSKMELVDE